MGESFSPPLYLEEMEMSAGIIGNIVTFAVLSLWVKLNGGEMEIIFPYIFYPAIFISILFIYLNGCSLSAGNKKSFLYWLIFSILPGIIIIPILKFIGRNSFFSWEFGLWDFILPLVILASQFGFFLFYKKL